MAFWFEFGSIDDVAADGPGREGKPSIRELADLLFDLIGETVRRLVRTRVPSAVVPQER